MLALPHNSVMLAALFFVGLAPKPRPDEKEPEPIVRPPSPTPPCTFGAVKQALKHHEGNVTLAAKSLGIRRMEFFEFVRASDELFSVITDARLEMVDMARQVQRQAVEKQQAWAVDMVIEECKENPPPSGSPQEELMKMALGAKGHIEARKKAKELRKRHERLQREAQLAAEAAQEAQSPEPTAPEEIVPPKPTLKQMEDEEARQGLQFQYPAEYLVANNLTWVLNSAEMLRKNPQLLERMLANFTEWVRGIEDGIREKRAPPTAI